MCEKGKSYTIYIQPAQKPGWQDHMTRRSSRCVNDCVSLGSDPTALLLTLITSQVPPGTFSVGLAISSAMNISTCTLHGGARTAVVIMASPCEMVAAEVDEVIGFEFLTGLAQRSGNTEST